MIDKTMYQISCLITKLWKTFLYTNYITQTVDHNMLSCDEMIVAYKLQKFL